MKQKIESAYIYTYRNEGHYEFNGNVLSLIAKFPIIETLVSAYLPEYRERYIVEGKLIDRKRKSDVTKQLSETDRLIDNCIAGIRKNIGAGMKHFDPTVSEAATSLYNRLKAYGKIERKAFEEESAAVELLVSEFQNHEYAPKAALVGITSWIVKLSEAETTFKSLFDLRNTEFADRPSGSIKEVRSEVDVNYYKVTNLINASAILDDTDTYTEFIKQLNSYIKYFNEHSYRHVKKDVKDVNVDAIPVQQATGEAITPIPTVYLEDQKLTFGSDFNLTYKNNIKPGTAILIIHGKNAYRGKREVTFNIEGEEKRLKDSSLSEKGKE
ncbi:MAG: DUF6261 family protein [Prevotellaceae bacterium]|jgi:hypothetical protein|nr:DUF6261 family protein [Prevotellaceae bacterium]